MPTTLPTPHSPTTPHPFTVPAVGALMGPNMPSVSTSVVCEPTTTTANSAAAAVATCSAAIRDSLASASSLVDRALQSAVKRTQLQKIDYEPAPPDFHNNVTDSLKSKYTVLNPPATPTSAAAAATAAASSSQNGMGTSASSAAAAHNGGHQLPTPKRCLFKRELVQIGWKQPGGRQWSNGTGMTNVGNTCYLNSTLQALFHVPAFANWLYADDDHRKRCEETNSQTECIICAMARTLHDTQTQAQCAKPWRVYSKLRQICRHLVPGHQEDAHEFLRYLVEAMEKAYLLRFKNSKEFDQLTKETTPLNQILGGYLKSSVRCLDCGHVSVTFQHFQDLLLDIRKSSTIDEALDTHFARERLEDMGYKCEACKKKVSATKQFSLERAPIALCIQLKRFSMMGSKLNKHVQFATRLNLSKYSARRGGSATDPQMTYRLVSMVTHLGSSQHCGHYTAVGQTNAGQYYTFDDSSVRPIGVQNVVQTNAYIMFYELEDPAAINGGVMEPATITLAAPVVGQSPQSTANGDGKRSFIGPVCPPEQRQKTATPEAKPAANGGRMPLTPPTPTTPSTPAICATTTTTTGDRQVSKLVLKISANQTLNKTWVGSAMLPNAVRIVNGHQNVSTANNNNTAATPKMNGSPFSAKKPLESNGTANTSTTFASTTNSQQARATLPTPLIGHKSASTTVITSASTVATPPSSPDAPPSKVKVTPAAAASPIASKTNGHTHHHHHHQPKVTKGFTTTNQRPLVPYDDDSSDAAGQSEDDCASNKSPPIVKTKAGDFQVTNAAVMISNGAATAVTNGNGPLAPPSTVSSANAASTNGGAGKKRFAVQSAHEALANGNGSGVSSTSVTGKLLKMSHQGYGALVSTWGGQESTMDQELKEDRLAEQRRRQNIDVDAEMDAGRQKKVKNNGAPASSMAGLSNPGFNVFQGTQNNINSGEHHWSSNFVANRKSKIVGGGAFGANGRKHSHFNHNKHNNNNHHNKNRHGLNGRNFNGNGGGGNTGNGRPRPAPRD